MSQFIRLDRVSFSYNKSPIPIFEDISVCFDAGWTAICGINGCGKTTLLNILRGELFPTSGSIECSGLIGYLAQDQSLTKAQIEELNFDFSKKAIRLKNRLDLNELLNRPFTSLSLGEQKRMLLAWTLRQNVDILIIDEPTNHADDYTKELILNELKRFYGVGILVSHDRKLLTRLATKTIFLENAQVLAIDAPFLVANSEKKSLESNQINLRQKLLKNIKKQSVTLQYKSEVVDKKAKFLSKKNISKNDHDKKDRVNRAKLFGADNSDTRAKKVFKQKLAKSCLELSSTRVKKEYQLGASFAGCALKKPIYFEKQTFTKNNLVINLPTITLKNKSALAIVGKNGSGKSTLLRHLSSMCPLEDFTFIPQELTEQERHTLLAKIHRLESEKTSQLYSLVRRLGSDPKPMVENLQLSPGLWQKLALALAIIDSHPLIMMDEPTNHMDLLAVEVLEKALKNYQGALIVISHDEEFINNVCTEKIELVRGGNITKATFLR